MSGKRSRDKGGRFERFLVHAFSVCFPDVHRGQQAHNPRHADIEGTPFRIEAKHWQKFSYQDVVNAINQAEDNGKEFGDERIPIAITKRDRESPIAHMKLNRLLQLIEKHFWREPEEADIIPIFGFEAYTDPEEDAG